MVRFMDPYLFLHHSHSALKALTDGLPNLLLRLAVASHIDSDSPEMLLRITSTDAGPTKTINMVSLTSLIKSMSFSSVNSARYSTWVFGTLLLLLFVFRLGCLLRLLLFLLLTDKSHLLVLPQDRRESHSTQLPSHQQPSRLRTSPE